MENKRRPLCKRFMRLAGKSCAALTLALLLALSGALSALPLAGDVFKPLTVHAGDSNLAANTIYVFDGANLKPQGSGAAIAFSTNDNITLNAGTVLSLNAPMTAGAVEVKGDGAKISMNGNAFNCDHIDIDSSAPNSYTFTIDGGSGTRGDLEIKTSTLSEKVNASEP